MVSHLFCLQYIFILGRFVATASGDTTSKVLDVSRFSNRGPKV